MMNNTQKKKSPSSFTINNSFNGAGDSVSIKASDWEAQPPLSQDNVQLSLDSNDQLQKILGSEPVIINPENMTDSTQAMLGSLSAANKVSLTLDANGNYVASFNVSSLDFTDSSYLQMAQTTYSAVSTVRIESVKGTWEKDGKLYKYFYQGGYLKNSWLQEDGYYYYLDNDGHMVTGWIKIDDKWYYLHSNGKLAINEWIPSGDNWFYCRSSGEMLKNDFRKGEDGKWYYCGADGKMVKGETVITWGGKQYFLHSDGSMAENKTVTYQGKTYTANSAGELMEASGYNVTAKMMKDFKWAVSNTELTKINNTLQKYGITDANSVRLFMATCAHESGKGSRALEYLNSNGTTAGNYLPTERGAGYIQLTWKATHLQFLATIPDTFSGTDTATYISQNYPWEASAWFWTSTNAKTIGKNPPMSLNEYVEKYGDSKDIYLMTQYAVNGWDDSPSDKILSDIRDGNISWNVVNGRVLVNGNDEGKAPNGWDDISNSYNRENMYYEAIQSF